MLYLDKEYIIDCKYKLQYDKISQYSAPYIGITEDNGEIKLEERANETVSIFKVDNQHNLQDYITTLDNNEFNVYLIRRIGPNIYKIVYSSVSLE